MELLPAINVFLSIVLLTEIVFLIRMRFTPTPAIRMLTLTAFGILAAGTLATAALGILPGDTNLTEQVRAGIAFARVASVILMGYVIIEAHRPRSA